MTMESIQAQINGPARIAAAGQLVEASAFYRQALQTLLIFNMVAFFACPALLLSGGALDQPAIDALYSAAGCFFAALALTILASFLAHLAIEKRAHAFLVEETVDERRARLAQHRATPDDARIVETEELAKQANAHASLSSTSQMASLFCVFLTALFMGIAVFTAMNTVSSRVVAANAAAAEASASGAGAAQ